MTIETLRRAWSFHSIKVATVIAVLSAIRTWAQQTVGTDPAWDWIGHAQWYAPAMTGLALLLAVLRMLPQSTPDVSPSPTAVATQLLGEHAMNNVWSEVLSHLPALATMAEQIAPNSGGVAKAAAVTTAVSQIVPAVAPMLNTSDGAAKLNAYLAAAVAMLNMLSPIFQKPRDTASTVTAAFNVPVSAFPIGSTGPA